MRAIRNAKELCNDYLDGPCDLEIIDIFQHPSRAKEDQILAVPTLVRKRDGSVRRFIGDLSRHDVVLGGLALRRK